MLGHASGAAALFAPETNIRYGVTYLARAWQLAGGDLCRALMKYRAGWGEEWMSPLSIEYCRRVRQYLAAIGSPLAGGVLPSAEPLDNASAIASGPSVAKAPASNTRQARPAGRIEVTYARELNLARAQARTRKSARTAKDSARFWAAHEARIREITKRLETRS
jgi:hypothetical protein